MRPFPLLAVGCLGLAACATPMSPTNEAKTHDSVKEGAARQIDRICALPEPQRQAEIRKLESESGLELQCAEAPKTP